MKTFKIDLRVQDSKQYYIKAENRENASAEAIARFLREGTWKIEVKSEEDKSCSS